jgi:tetratricopeptide (TPR) repeat protein
VRLAWDLLDPKFEEELRTRYGYVDSATEEVMVTADRVRTVDGEEIVGLIVHRTEDAIHIKTAQRLIALPKLRVAGPAVLVRAPALDIYTREELYQKELAERRSDLARTGKQGAEANFALAQYCERILDYASAVHHYEEAARLEPDWRPKDLAAALARSRRKAEAQEQIDALGEIRRERQLGHYELALDLVAAFRTQYPDSPLAEDLRTMEASVERARERELSEAVVRRWHTWAIRLTREAARKLDYDAALEWVGSELPGEIRAAVRADLAEIDPEITMERVEELWRARPLARSHHASYGSGTWLLGDDRARAGLDDEEEEAAPTDEREEARRDLEERIRRFLDRQRTVDRARGGEAGGDPAAFWKEWGSTGRAQWLLAYWAEFSGDVEVVHVRFRPCRECGGRGVREIGYSGPAVSGQSGQRSRLVSCPSCHHVGIVRRISYR